jgi:two-component system nitrate/nitrite response regulator NarL
MPSVRILIADDHPVYRQGLRALFRDEVEFIIVGEAVDGEQALKLVDKLYPDVLLLDLQMPKLTGLEALRELSGASTSVRPILLTASIEKEQIVQALQLGARGIVLKDASTETLFKSIRTVMKGKFWVGEKAVPNLVDVLRTNIAAGGEAAQRAESRETKNTFGLTPRELEVVGSIVTGLTNREIAGKFSISEQTVKHHLSNIFDKVGVSNRLELALFAINHHLC